MGEPILRDRSRNGPPSCLQVNSVPAHGTHFCATLGGEETQFAISLQYRGKLLKTFPHRSNFVLIQDTIPRMFFPRGLYLEAGIMFEQVSTDGPVEDFAHEGQHPIGLNRGPTLIDRVEEGNDITASNRYSGALSPGWEHFLGQEPRIVTPALFVDFGILVEIEFGDVCKQGRVPGVLLLCGGVLPLHNGVFGRKCLTPRLSETQDRIGPERQTPETTLDAIHDKPGFASTWRDTKSHTKGMHIKVIDLPSCWRLDRVYPSHCERHLGHCLARFR
jgi:hypothetical protein